MAGSGGDSRARLIVEGLDPGEWSNGPNDHYAAHEHGYDKVIVVASGGIVFYLEDRGETLGLFTGDRLELPAGTTHEAHVSPSGVSCLEAHLPAGSLHGGPSRRPAGTW